MCQPDAAGLGRQEDEARHEGHRLRATATVACPALHRVSEGASRVEQSQALSLCR